MARRWTSWSATVLSAVLALSVLGLPQALVARDSEGVPDVVVRHAPVVYFHPDETLLPYPADLYYERSDQVLVGDADPPYRYLRPGEDVGTRTLIGSAPAYYEYEPGRYIIYWFFHSLDRQGATGSFFDRDTVKEHDGDWEHVVVRLDANDQPTDIAYYQHDCKPVEFAWTSVPELIEGTHPAVYSALGSHASYWEPLRRTEPIGADCPSVRFFPDDIRFDVVEQGDAWETWKDVGLVDARSEDWYGYPGLWGPPDAELLSLDPDLRSDIREYWTWNSGGRGPGDDRVEDVIPDGWDEPRAAATPKVVWVKKGTTKDASHVPYGEPVTLTTRFHGDADVAEVRFTAFYPDWPNAKNAAKLPGFDPKATWRTLKVCRPKTKGCTWEGDRQAATVSYTWDPTVGEKGRSIPGVPKADPAVSLNSEKCVPVTLGIDVVDAEGTITSGPGGKIAQRCDAKATGLARTVYLDPLAPPAAPGNVRLVYSRSNSTGCGPPYVACDIRVRWRDRSSGEAGFRVYVGPVERATFEPCPGFEDSDCAEITEFDCGSMRLVAEVPANVTSISFDLRKSDTQGSRTRFDGLYCLDVVASNAAGDSVPNRTPHAITHFWLY